jgi:hypothetical protein
VALSARPCKLFPSGNSGVATVSIKHASSNAPERAE